MNGINCNKQNLSQEIFLETNITGKKKLAIFVRLYQGALLEYYSIFSLSFLLFSPKFPYQLYLILDEEILIDHYAGVVLENVPPYPKIIFEPYFNHTYCSKWRREGYSRQVFSFFLLDQYSDSEFVSLFDSDSFLVSPFQESLIFENGKPRLYGYNGCCTGWCKANDLLGIPCVSEFMVVIGFPVIIYSKHLQECRNYITKKLNVTNFNEAFHVICSLENEKAYSQFDIICNYLFHFHKDEYSWHLKKPINHPVLKYPIPNNSFFKLDEFNRPIQGFVKHFGHQNFNNIFPLIADYFCFANPQLKTCQKLMNDQIIEGVVANFYTDALYETGDWKTRKMPKVHGPWQKGEQPWIDIKNIGKNK